MTKPIIPGGYILLSRKTIDSEIWKKPPMYLKVWIFILLKAQHKEYRNLKRGQTIISIPEIIEACSYKVGYRTEKPSYKQIHGILKWLRNPNKGDAEGNGEGSMIVTSKVTHGMLVEVCNYNVYQEPKNYESNSERQTKGTMEEQRRELKGNNKYKNDKNDNNDNNVNKMTSRSKLKFGTHHMELAELLFSEMLKNNPNAKKPNLESWANTFRLMMERDERPGKEIQELILWSQSHHFWDSNILSANSLRKHYDRLLLERRKESKNPLKVINGGRADIPVDEQFKNLF